MHFELDVERRGSARLQRIHVSFKHRTQVIYTRISGQSFYSK